MARNFFFQNTCKFNVDCPKKYLLCQNSMYEASKNYFYRYRSSIIGITCCQCSDNFRTHPYFGQFLDRDPPTSRTSDRLGQTFFWNWHPCSERCARLAKSVTRGQSVSLSCSLPASPPLSASDWLLAAVTSLTPRAPAGALPAGNERGWREEGRNCARQDRTGMQAVGTGECMPHIRGYCKVVYFIWGSGS